MDINKLTPTERMFANSMVIGAIVFFSQLATAGWPPTYEIAYTAFVGSALAGLMQIKTLFSDNEKRDNDDDDKKQPPLRLGMLI